MSAQFGKWNFNGKQLAADQVSRLQRVLRPYGPDRTTSYRRAGVDILYHAFHTTTESEREIEPYILPSDAVLTWDGRLDNREELIRLVDASTEEGPTDLDIVARSYERWGTNSFAKLLGDWALSVWDPRERSLTLARDPIGTRHLYYTRDDSEFTWSTILDPLVLFRPRALELEEEYIAGWLGGFPAVHLTPYVGIHAVPPASFLRADDRNIRNVRYWDFDPSRKVRYRTDGDYEEHFRCVFKTAVKRRLRANAPVLAELSGGVDSSSIVSMADLVIADGDARTPRLDTVSYYDDSEPDWNERPYFEAVEKQRGREGWHIDLGAVPPVGFEVETDEFLATPSSKPRHRATRNPLATRMASAGTRVILSGIGGDEITGGPPTPIPELADLFARAHFGKLARQLKRWALEKRKPWIHVFRETFERFLPVSLASLPEFSRPGPWLEPAFVNRQWAALTGYEKRLRLPGPLPSFQDFVSTLEAVRRQIGCTPPSAEPLCEKRYPYLDRDFLEFMAAVPREQLVRPGERRSLMRRALVGVVPEEILRRKRKAFVARGPRLRISAEWDRLTALSQDMVSASLGIVDPAAFRQTLERVRSGQQLSIVPVLRTIQVESWLRNVRSGNVPEGRSLEPTATTLTANEAVRARLSATCECRSQLRKAGR